MARLNLSRSQPSSQSRKTTFSSSSESDSNNSDEDSEFPDLAALPPSPKKKNATKKRVSPPTESESVSSSRNQTVVESATSPNAASSSVAGVKRRKLLLGAVSDNVLFRKWTPTEDDAVPGRKKKRVLTANNPFGLRLPLGMIRDERGEASDLDSEAENPVVRRKNMKVKEVKRVGESTSTVTAQVVRRATEDSLSSGRVSVSKEHGKARDVAKKAKEKEKEEKLSASQSLFRPPASKEVASKSKDMMEIDEDQDMEMFDEDLEDFVEKSFHTAQSKDSSSEQSDGLSLDTTTARKGQNTTNIASNLSKDDDSDEEDLEAFFSKINNKPEIPAVRESHLSPTKPRATKNSRGKRMDATRESQSRRTSFDEEESDERKRPARATQQKTACSDEDEDTCGEEDVTQDFSCLQLESSSSSEGGLDEKGRSRPPTVAGTRKRTRTPSPPHKVIPKLKPNSDLFWSREFVDDWNDEHSPKKELFPSGPSKPLADSPKKKCPRAPSPQKVAAAQARESRLLRQAFDAHKHSLATDFLVLLDARLTSSRLSALTASTGGIKLVWSKTLNTTAGRANWKKESITTRPSKQEANKEEKKEVKHHASIELATKVLSTPERLFNTLAHEFCHLAVFMIDGVTTRPHGAEFKAWARKVNDEFGRHRCPFGKLVVGEGETRGKWEGGYAVEVTTRHGYEIEFRYVWVCDGPVSGVEGKDKGCGTEYKRHSKSVDPSRHRCGVCKGVLRQVKPAPRGQQEGGGGGNTSSADGKQPGTQGGMGTNRVKEKATKTSEYQVFVKEQMKVVKAQKPGLAFGEVMKEVAERWKVEKTKREKEKKVTPMPSAETAGKLSTLLEEVIADEDDDGENSPDVFEDEPMMDVVDLTADD